MLTEMNEMNESRLNADHGQELTLANDRNTRLSDEIKTLGAVVEGLKRRAEKDVEILARSEQVCALMVLGANTGSEHVANTGYITNQVYSHSVHELPPFHACLPPFRA